MKKALLMAGLVGLTGLSSAAEFDERWMISPMINFHAVDSAKGLESDFGWGIGLGKFVSENWSVEGEFDTARFTADTGNGAIDQYAAGIMARYHFGEKGSLRPFLGFGGGYIDHDGEKAWSGVKSDDIMLNLSAGVRKKINDRFGFTSEIKYRIDNDDIVGSQSSYDDYIFTMAMNVAIGAASKSAVAEDIVTPAPVDSDGDGVSDQDDRCPNTPAGAQVDMYGCELDSDNDGVVNSKDKCPDSKPGAVVDADGCEVEVVIELQGVHFDFDKSSLRAESFAILDAAVSTLSTHGKIAVEVAGHTDSKGSESYNQALSERRAQVVKDYLVNKGISADRLTSKGYGESSPMADNATEEGRAKNRRTELIIQD
ncbi:OmpA family protein [Marinicella rhabdoformis]|uniref:OmpA family protein n=1 Tax=Marinicella rhabdoformis TaxID=2580566 RepID=UPI0012AEC6F4|nr:OmpA family protein [Marinicella rhabdoformis]